MKIYVDGEIRQNMYIMYLTGCVFYVSKMYRYLWDDKTLTFHDNQQNHNEFPSDRVLLLLKSCAG